MYDTGYNISETILKGAAKGMNMGKIKSKHIELGLIIIVLLLVIGVKLIDASAMDETAQGSAQETGLSNENQAEIQTKNQVETVKVYVKGAVHSPGVYALSADARIEDALKMAGGATEEAELTGLNLAGRVYDTQEIVLYKKGEVPVKTAENPIGSWTLQDLNEATAARLCEIGGIGEKMAEKIIAYRNDKGPFNHVDELIEISGIGEKKLASIKDVFSEAALK